MKYQSDLDADKNLKGPRAFQQILDGQPLHILIY